MQRISLKEAQGELEQLLDAAMRGETVFIVGDDEQAVQLVPVTARKQERHAGSAKGLLRMAADFDAPLPDFSEYTE